MTRQQKYPNTETFHFHNANPKGKYTSDCVVRAISTATGKLYRTVVIDLAEMEIKTGYDASDPKCYGKYLESLGWHKNKQPRKDDNTKYTGKEFCEEVQCIQNRFGYMTRGACIAHIGGNHVVAIMHGQVWDTWDSTDGCIGNYWTK